LRLHLTTLTAANGDSLVFSCKDVACHTGSGGYIGTGQWTVTPGTGRFTGATGQGTDNTQISPNGEVSKILTGTISAPNAN